MSKKSDVREVGRILRKRGSGQTPGISVSTTEIRSCGVMGNPEPVEVGTQGLLGGVVIMWEYEVQYEDLAAFRVFIDANEVFLEEAVRTLQPHARYLGTYALNEGGTPVFRTIWAYDELQTMLDMWADLADGNLKTAVKELRKYWLKDPGRHEARWTPARRAITGPGHDHMDGFAQLTIDAAEELNP